MRVTANGLEQSIRAQSPAVRQIPCGGEDKHRKKLIILPLDKAVSLAARPLLAAFTSARRLCVVAFLFCRFFHPYKRSRLIFFLSV